MDFMLICQQESVNSVHQMDIVIIVSHIHLWVYIIHIITIIFMMDKHQFMDHIVIHVHQVQQLMVHF